MSTYSYQDKDGDEFSTGIDTGGAYLQVNADAVRLLPEDAPAVALAILRAADTPDNHADVHCAISSLIEYEHTRTRQAEREAEDAKVVEFHTAIGANLNRIERHHRDLYNAARKFFEES